MLSRSTFSATTAPGNDPGLIGTWLPQSAIAWNHSQLSRIRLSKLVISSHSFSLSNYSGASSDIRSTFTTASNTIDLKNEEIDLSASGSRVKYPATQVPGIYKIEGDLLTVCIQTGSKAVRPKTFAADLDNEMLLVFRKAALDFKEYPRQLTLAVVGPDDKPVLAADVFQFMSFWHDRKKPATPRQWHYGGAISKTDGAWVVPYKDFSNAGARDINAKLIGFVTASSAEVGKGSAIIHMQPQCLLSGKLTCDELSKAGKPLGWTNVYLLKNGEQIAMCESDEGEYYFPVAPGDYTLDAYGTILLSKYVSINVPPSKQEFQAPPIAMCASHLEMLKGHLAPELSGIVGWKGKPITLASLRGQYVLIDFWGYWCGPCVYSMPVLMNLHEKYKDKGLAILTVHIDVVGNVDTAAKLDEKIAGLRKSIWHGRDLPFSTALSDGTNTPDKYDGITASQYGIHSYPTTILIDRQGNVVGEFAARDFAVASAEIERLLGSH